MFMAIHLSGFSKMYQAPTIQTPSVEELQQISESQRLGIGPADMRSYHETISGMFKNSYSVLEKYIEPTLPVKYPRTPGHRPLPEDNKYNAWYYQAEIRGAPDGPLKGHKVVVKDCFPVAGVPMMLGSRVVEGYVPDYDPTVVTRVLDGGAVIVGKATCEDFCYSGNSFTSHPFPVLNPHDTTRATGGSSSGCAALVQTGEADMAIGGDQGGSLRMPAAWTGIVGFKPTYGLVPYTGLGALATPLDVCGPMTRTVKDCALLLQTIAGDDRGRDMRQRRVPPPEEIPKYSERLDRNMSGKKIGLVVEGFAGCEDDVASVVKETAQALRTKGATVEEVSIPIHNDVGTFFLVTCVDASYHSMVTSQGYNVGPPSYYPTSAIDSYKAFTTAHARDFSPTVKLVHLMGKYISDNYGMHFYAKSQNLLCHARDLYDEKLAEYDVLVMPTMLTKPPKIPGKEATTSDVLANTLNMVRNTSPFSGTGHPAISVNAGHSEGLPVGMMIVGRHMHEQTVLNVAYAYEQMLLGK